MVTPEGKVVGQHQGLMYYTLGQRQGLGIGGPGEPWFVAGKARDANRLVVVQGHNHPLLHSRALCAGQLSWTLGQPPAPGRYAAKNRYRMQDAPCVLSYDTAGQAVLTFDSPQWAITPGQSAVLYDGNVCLGGGVIIGAPEGEA